MSTVSVRHSTRYRYTRPVSLGEHRMMFRPRESYDQHVLESRLVIIPEPVEVRYVHDVFGNCVGVARFDAPTTELSFESFVRLERRPTPVDDLAPDVFESSESVFPCAYSVEDLPDLLRCIERHHADPDGALERWARQFIEPEGPTRILDMLSRMTRAIHTEFTYTTRLFGGAQSPSQTLASRSGSCRDFAVLMMEAARIVGLAARFVSGYIYCPSDPAEEPRLGGGHTHAWVSIYLPSCGWVEFDPTNGIVGNSDLIRVAVARDPRQALPLSGAYIGSADDFLGMDVSVDVITESSTRTFALAS